MHLKDAAVMEKALRDGVDPDAVYFTDYGWTILHMEAAAVKVVQLIIDWGGDVNARDTDGRLPLWWARHATTCMLENGADPMCSYESMKTKQREIDAFRAKRDTILRLLLSIDGLSKGLALRVGWWVVQTH